LQDTRIQLFKTYETGTNGIPTYISTVSLLCREVRIEQNEIDQQNSRRMGTVVTHALRPHLTLGAALIFMHQAAPHLEQSAASC
jgi:hypothetical protein